MSHRREILLTQLMIAFTAIATVLAYAEIGSIGVELFRAHDLAGLAGQVVFAALFAVFVYSYIVYLTTRVGQLRRRGSHAATPGEALDTVFSNESPSIAASGAAYKEQPAIVRRTLLSAALQQYPWRQVVLLIDDPYHPQDRADAANLAAMRALPGNVQSLIEPLLRRCEQAHRGFVDRCLRGTMEPDAEAVRLSEFYAEIATWFDREISAYPVHDHGDVLFVEGFLTKCRDGHRARAEMLGSCAAAHTFDCAAARREYRRLVALFRVKVTSFERKRYENLSHEVNKAMNLNSYIGLMGGSYREVAQGDGRDALLHPAPSGAGTLDIPTADYLLTVDADSVLLPDYAATLAHFLIRPKTPALRSRRRHIARFRARPGCSSGWPARLPTSNT
jgi:cellulose synthase/poly-beta-1,6-N-acetylglucosamine synthase-like glycosyltransferase